MSKGYFKCVMINELVDIEGGVDIESVHIIDFVYEGILWTKCTTYSVLQDFDQWRRVKRSEGKWR